MISSAGAAPEAKADTDAHLTIILALDQPVAFGRHADQHGPVNFGVGVAAGETGSSHLSVFTVGRDQPTVYAVLGCADYTFQNTQHRHIAFRWRLGKMRNGVLVGIPFVAGHESSPGYTQNKDHPLPAPTGAHMAIAELNFVPDPVGGNHSQ